MIHFGHKTISNNFVYGVVTVDRLNAQNKAPWVRTPWWLFWKKPWRRQCWTPDSYLTGAYYIGWEYCDHTDFLFM